MVKTMKPKQKYPFAHKGVGFRLLKLDNGNVCGVRLQGLSKDTIFFQNLSEDMAKKEAMRMIDELKRVIGERK